MAADIERAPVESFEVSTLGENPWVLVPGPERSIIRASWRDAQRLSDATDAIFTGLQTSADKVYIVEDRGLTTSGRRVYSKALDREVVLEPDLLHPLASGAEIERWAPKPLDNLLIFPYRDDTGTMRLLTPDELSALPQTDDYLKQNEELLRNRERGKMDHDGWYGYVYPKSLALQAVPKLGVPRLCERLKAAVDPEGEVYLDNVDVNGVVPSSAGPSIWSLAAILQSRLLDFLFRRGSVPFRGAFYSANKQFISWLPIKVLPGESERELAGLANDLYESSKGRSAEVEGFRGWLAGVIGVPITDLANHTKLERYDEMGVDGVLAILRKNRMRLEVNLDSRAFAETLATEMNSSVERLAEFDRVIRDSEPLVDKAVYDLYEMTSQQRAIIDGEYVD